MPERTCSFDGCDRKHWAKGLCGTHYRQLQKRGTREALTPIEVHAGRTCSFPGCDRKHAAQGFCQTHYRQLRKRGTPEALTAIVDTAATLLGVPCPRCGSKETYARGKSGRGKPSVMCRGCDRRWVIGGGTALKPPRGLTPDEMFDYYEKKEVPSALPGSPCLVWQGSCTRSGYGRFTASGQAFQAHVFAWEREHGRPMPKGSHVDHVCHNRACVNPLHLKEVKMGPHQAMHRQFDTELNSRLRALVGEDVYNEVKRQMVADRMRKHLTAWWWHYAA